jgi:hypothetical protein
VAIEGTDRVKAVPAFLRRHPALWVEWLRLGNALSRWRGEGSRVLLLVLSGVAVVVALLAALWGHVVSAIETLAEYRLLLAVVAAIYAATSVSGRRRELEEARSNSWLIATPIPPRSLLISQAIRVLLPLFVLAIAVVLFPALIALTNEGMTAAAEKVAGAAAGGLLIGSVVGWFSGRRVKPSGVVPSRYVPQPRVRRSAPAQSRSTLAQTSNEAAHTARAGAHVAGAAANPAGLAEAAGANVTRVAEIADANVTSGTETAGANVAGVAEAAGPSVTRVAEIAGVNVTSGAVTAGANVAGVAEVTGANVMGVAGCAAGAYLRPDAAGLSGWPIAQVLAWSRPENSRYVLIAALLAVQGGSSALTGLSVVAMYLVASYLAALLSAMTAVAKSAAIWLRATPITMMGFVWSVSRRALAHQLVGVALAIVCMLLLGSPMSMALQVAALWLGLFISISGFALVDNYRGRSPLVKIVLSIAAFAAIATVLQLRAGAKT